MNFGNVINLEAAGVYSDIYDAIDTYDMAKVVRAAMNGLNKINWTLPVCDTKSKAVSTDSRNSGNTYYKNGKIREAVQYYNKALAYAPNHSVEMMHAYANRSVVFFSIRYFSACVNDINTCLSMGCSEGLANKLRKRRDDTTPFMYEEDLIQMKTNCVFNNTFLRFHCKRNPDVPCASADVAFVSRDGVKRATAGADIRPGTVVAIERAFASCPAENSSAYVTCYYCNRADLRLQPCVGCCRALFCSDKCRDLCMKEYHSIECQIVGYFNMSNEVNAELMMKTAIKMSLKMNWDEFITASKDIGASRMRTATVRQTFNSEEPLSILSYDDGIEQFLEGKMFKGSLMCAIILHCLDRVPEHYFPTERTKREAVVDAMARVMLQLYVTFSNKILFDNGAYDFNLKLYRGVHAHLGWFSMSSKLQHSCEPNLLVIGLNSSVALMALRTIKRGEELTISYGGHFYNTTLKNELREIYVFWATRRMCDCRVCKQNWDGKSRVVTVEMTDKQSKLFAKVNEKPIVSVYKSFNSICASLDTFPINSFQYKCAFNGLKQIVLIPQSKHNNNITFLN